jgi:hypothetical protein
MHLVEEQQQQHNKNQINLSFIDNILFKCSAFTSAVKNHTQFTFDKEETFLSFNRNFLLKKFINLNILNLAECKVKKKQ